TLNKSKGTYTIINSVTTRKFSSGGRNYISHTPCGADSVDIISWDYNWSAPPTNVGKIKFYISTLVANHDHALSGDTTYTKVLELKPAMISGIEDNNKASLSVVVPTISANEFKVKIDNRYENELKRILVLNMDGKVVVNLSCHSQEIVFGNESIKDKGVYLIQIKCMGNLQNLKIVKL
ncbi:MAG: hypothetical protein ABIO44_11660, partial [Saprospiraceae bacterium]